ncbi:MAG: TetR family transcriptional regulator C-terminal domain-containing protein, partial [Pseudonocardia sp.]|nr:TetR family transcriptional regulator C-terminal domain-containing protein [Pseudonocardia sp.]
MKDVARQRLLDALVAITAERGLDRASMREVAAAAGVAIGTVQYYCRSKDEMLRMAFEYVIDRIIARVTAIPESDRAAHMLRHGVLEFLPLDELRRVEARVYLAFTARAAISPPLARLQHDLQTQMREKCTRAFALARQRGEAVADFDPEAAARATMAMVDGLMLHMLTDPAGMPADAAITVLDEHLHRFLNLEPI